MAARPLSAGLRVERQAISHACQCLAKLRRPSGFVMRAALLLHRLHLCRHRLDSYSSKGLNGVPRLLSAYRKGDVWHRATPMFSNLKKIMQQLRTVRCTSYAAPIVHHLQNCGLLDGSW